MFALMQRVVDTPVDTTEYPLPSTMMLSFNPVNRTDENARRRRPQPYFTSNANNYRWFLMTLLVQYIIILSCINVSAEADYHYPHYDSTVTFRDGRRRLTRSSVPFVGSNSKKDYVQNCLTIRGGDNGNNKVIQKEQQSQKQQQSQPSPYEYIPITALNNYGSSTQLRHAMECSERYGTPVIACICCHDEENDSNGNGENDEDNTNNKRCRRMENAIMVCSLQRPRPGIIAKSITSNLNKNTGCKNKSIHPSIQGMVRLLATRDDVDNNTNDNTIHTAIVTTGIQSDATFLLNTLQRHLISKYWFRYDTLPSSSSTPSSSSKNAAVASSANMVLIKMIRDILLDCLGYDRAEEVYSGNLSGGIGSAAPSYTEEDNDDENNGNGGSSQKAGRPLGISIMLLGGLLDASSSSTTTSTTATATSVPNLTLIKTNGSTSNAVVANAMGIGSKLANSQLSKLWKRQMTKAQSKQMMVGILRQVAVDEGWLSKGDDDDGNGIENVNERMNNSELIVVCETVTSRGVNIEYISL